MQRGRGRGGRGTPTQSPRITCALHRRDRTSPYTAAPQPTAARKRQTGRFSPTPPPLSRLQLPIPLLDACAFCHTTLQVCLLSHKHTHRKHTVTMEKANQPGVESASALQGPLLPRQVRRIHGAQRPRVVAGQRGHGHPDTEQVGNNILDRVGSLFDGAKGGAWWYSCWCSLHVIVLGTILASITTPEANAVAALVRSVLDSVFPAQWSFSRQPSPAFSGLWSEQSRPTRPT